VPDRLQFVQQLAARRVSPCPPTSGGRGAGGEGGRAASVAETQKTFHHETTKGTKKLVSLEGVVETALRAKANNRREAPTSPSSTSHELEEGMSVLVFFVASW
jgi:hypothetical protein